MKYNNNKKKLEVGMPSFFVIFWLIIKQKSKVIIRPLTLF